MTEILHILLAIGQLYLSIGVVLFCIRGSFRLIRILRFGAIAPAWWAWPVILLFYTLAWPIALWLVLRPQDLQSL